MNDRFFSGHENRGYVLTGDPAVSFADIAAILSKIHGRDVPFIATPDQDYLDLLKSTAGVPDFVAEFALAWGRGMNDGEWQAQTKDLETLIGHKPRSATEYFRDDYLLKEIPRRSASLASISSLLRLADTFNRGRKKGCA